MFKKIGIVGTGKTGSFVQSLLEDHHCLKVGGAFNSKNPLDLTLAKSLDGLIVFVNAETLTKIMPILLKTNIPIVCGTTGFNYQHYEADFKIRNSSFIYGSNFSLGVHATRKMLEVLNKVKPLLSPYKIEIKEIHHTKKLDAPSGTAKSMEKWIDETVNIQSIREGDVVGYHELTLSTEFETIKISHNAHSREVFAQGAINVMETILTKEKQFSYLSVDQFIDLNYF